MATISTDTPVNPLRQRMQHDMMMRGLLPRTQEQYIRHVRRFSAYLGRPPDTATTEDLRNFQIQQHESGASAGTINGAVSALRFLYTVTLRRRDLARGLIATRRPDKMREVLSVEEAARLLEAAPGIKYKAALGVAYGAGLRVSEVAHLKVDDIDSQRMLIRVEQGKGGRDRNAMLSPQLLELLRMWWREGKRRGVMFPHGWLFPGRSCQWAPKFPWKWAFKIPYVVGVGFGDQPKDGSGTAFSGGRPLRFGTGGGLMFAVVRM